MAIIAILATLLMTTLGSVKRKAREAVCTSNLHQIGLALNLYLDDFGQRPASLQHLAKSKYLGNGRVLICPADRSVLAPRLADASITKTPDQASNATEDLPVSYEDPLKWSDDEWSRLMQAHTRAGVVVCTRHDVRSPGHANTLPGALLLRGQLDGVVVRRHIADAEVQVTTPTNLDRGADNPFVGSGFAGEGSNVATSPPWNFFSDDPPPNNSP
jgi:type II secretory pathway pseudopilin PulG